MSNFSTMGPSGNLVKLSESPSDIDPVPRALWVGTAGSATMEDESGNTLTDFPLQAGMNPIRVRKLITLTNADDVWAFY